MVSKQDIFEKFTEELEVLTGRFDEINKKRKITPWWRVIERIKNTRHVDVEKLRVLVKENERLEKEIEELKHGVIEKWKKKQIEVIL